MNSGKTGKVELSRAELSGGKATDLNDYGGNTKTSNWPLHNLVQSKCRIIKGISFKISCRVIKQVYFSISSRL